MPGLMGCYVQETGNPVDWFENNQYQQGMCEHQRQKLSAKVRCLSNKAIIGGLNQQPSKYNPLYIDCASRGGIVQQTFIHHALHGV
jgi:hypothetical protein